MCVKTYNTSYKGDCTCYFILVWKLCVQNKLLHVYFYNTLVILICTHKYIYNFHVLYIYTFYVFIHNLYIYTISIFLCVPNIFHGIFTNIFDCCIKSRQSDLHFSLVSAKSSCSLKVSSISICALALRKF